MPLRFHVAGLEVEVVFTGSPPVLIGYYDSYPPTDAKPALLINATIRAEQGLAPSAPDPSFEISHSGSSIGLRRNDVEGHFEFHSDGQLVGHFELPSWPTGLEAVLRIGISLLLPSKGALLLHSSAVADDRGAFVFSGVSGAGKSTISDLVGTNFEADKISDELLILQKYSDGWRIIVAPFSGSPDLPHGRVCPLNSVYLLRQAKTHTLLPMTQAEAMEEFSRHIVNFAQSTHALGVVLDLTADLVTNTPFHALAFAKDPSIGNVLGFDVVATRA